MCLWYCHPKNTAVLVAPRTDWMLFLAKRMLRRARLCITFYAFIGLCGRVRFIVTTRISGTLFFRVCLFTVKVVFFPREITDYKCRLTPLRVGWIETGPSLSGRLHSLVLCWWVSSPESHTTRTRGPLRVTTSTLRDPSGSGRVDTLTSPVAAARAAVATGAWVESKHDM